RVLRIPATFDAAASPELVERLGNTAFVPIRGLFQQFEGERPAYYARNAGQFVRSCCKLCQTRSDYSLHPRALQSGPDTLYHEEWIAPRGIEDLSEVPRFAR